MYYLINIIVNTLKNIIINIFQYQIKPIYALEYVDNPSYILEKGLGGYCIYITEDLFKFHKNITFVNNEKNIIATINLIDKRAILYANEDLIIIGFEFTDLDLIIKSNKNIVFKGSMILKTLDLKAVNFSFENLTANYLSITVSENLIGIGILNLENSLKKSELNASFGIVLNQDVTIVGNLLIEANSIVIGALLGIGNGDLTISACNEFINYGTITVANKIIFKGAGTFINSGKIISNDAFTLEAIENRYISLKNLQNATLECLSESILGINIDVENYGEIISNKNIDLIGKTLLNYSIITSKGLISFEMDKILQIGDIISELEINIISKNIIINLGLIQSKTNWIKIQSQQLIHKGHFECKEDFLAEILEKIYSAGSIISTGKISFITKDLKISGKIFAEDDIIVKGDEIEIKESIDGKNITINDAKKVILRKDGKLSSTFSIEIKSEILENHGDRIESEGPLRIISNTINNSSIIKSYNMTIISENLNNYGLIETKEYFIFEDIEKSLKSYIKTQNMNIGGEAFITVGSIHVISNLTSHNLSLSAKNLEIKKDAKICVINYFEIKKTISIII